MPRGKKAVVSEPITTKKSSKKNKKNIQSRRS